MSVRRKITDSQLAPNPLWFKEAIIYELHVRAFADSNADGIGDFPGLIGKLDYLRDLGVTALWLLPFYPSPGRDGGYDIADYTAINPVYGELDDFKRFLDEAHRRGLRVITELVLNHTSADHAWFQRARRAPAGSPERDFYVWSDTPDRYTDARIIFKDFETSNWAWDPLVKAYYWHRFYSHQPDLNFDNPAVHQALLDVVDFWLAMGVDGLRLDAVPYLYEREGTSSENLAETHAFLKKLRAHVDEKHRDKMLLAEANQWPIDAASYFGNGDECHMNFHFPLMPRMFMAVQLEDRFPIVDILRQTPVIPAGCQWATFLRNHDELTLEMVTDEDRDYMYRVYAEDPNARLNLGIRRRLAPLLRSRRKIELMTALLFSMPGTPVLYYGDELGMGDNIYLGDRDGVRTPMQWSADRNAGFSAASPQRLYLPIINDREYHYEATNVETQQQNPSSLLWWTKRLIAVSKRHRAFGSGAIEFLLVQFDNPGKVLAFIRSTSRSARSPRSACWWSPTCRAFQQHCELDLSMFEGLAPVELFGRVRFPAIAKTPYFLSLGPHTFYWFALEPATHEVQDESVCPRSPRRRPCAICSTVRAPRSRSPTSPPGAAGSAPRPIHASPQSAGDVIEIRASQRCVLALLDLDYDDADPETYVMAPAFVATPPGADVVASGVPEGKAHAIIARTRIGEVDGILYDALATGTAAGMLAELVKRSGRIAGDAGVLVGQSLPGFAEAVGDHPLTARLLEVEQSNSVFPIADALLMKVFREVEPGPNPEVEIGEFLAAQPGERVAPRLLGTILHQPPRGPSAAVATIHELVRHQSTGWDLTLAALERTFERVLTTPAQEGHTLPARLAGTYTARAKIEADEETKRLIGSYLEQVRQLGRRTATLHRKLASVTTNPDFIPEPFHSMHQQSIYQTARAPWPHVHEAAARPREPAGRGSAARRPGLEARERDRRPSARRRVAPLRDRPDPLSRRPAPRPGALSGRRFSLHRLRG